MGKSSEVKCLVSSRAMLFWTFCLLALLQAVAGIILNMFAHQYFQEAMHDLSKREAVYLYFGTFTRSFLSMFEIMLLDCPSVSLFLRVARCSCSSV